MAVAEDGSVLWAWQCFEEGKWGLISGTAHHPTLGAVQVVAIHRKREIAEQKFRSLAKAHHQTHGSPVRLAQFKLIGEVAMIGGQP